MITARACRPRSGRSIARPCRGSAPCPRSLNGTRTFLNCRSCLPRLAPSMACSRRPELEVVMPALRDLQRLFKDGLLADDEETVLAHIAGDGLDPRARLVIYRHHVLKTLTSTLESAFPVVCQLVDKRFFAYAADAFIREHPPAGACLVEYGALFPEFLEGFPPCQGHPYLPDMARLEWAVHQAAQVAEVRPLDRARFDAIPLDDLPGLRFSMDPTLSYVSSPWPVDKIWRTNQEGAEPAELDLSAGGTCLEVRRVGDGVSVRVLDPAAYALRHALAVGLMLEEAAAEALAVAPSFDLIGAIQKLLQDRIFTDFTLST